MVPDFSLLLRPLILAFCTTTLGLSLIALGREVSVALVLQAVPDQPAIAMRQFDPDLHIASVPALTQMMRHCADLLLVDDMVRLSPQLRGEIAVICQSVTKKVLRKNPSFARALAVALLVGDNAYFSLNYARAQTAAPAEPWPLQVRILAADRAARRQAGALAPDLQALVATDLQRLLQLDLGPALLAQLYAQNAALRPLIETLAQTGVALPVTLQRSVAHG
jgi:hypothetical protein